MIDANFNIADNSATVELMLWQDFISAVSLEKSYEMINLVVKTLNDKNTLFTPQLIKEIQNLRNVVPLANLSNR